jgi:hypothetical protein
MFAGQIPYEEAAQAHLEKQAALGVAEAKAPQIVS